MAKEVCNEEATKHQAHGQQGGVGVGPCNLQLVNGYVATWKVLDMLPEDRVEGVLRWVVQMVVVQNQRVGFEDLRWEVRESRVRDNKGGNSLKGYGVYDGKWMKRWGEETLKSLLKVS